MEDTFTLSAVALAAFALALPRVKRRLELSRAKHRSLAGHARMAKRVVAQIPGYAYDEAAFFSSDDATPEVIARRRAGFARLAASLATRSPRTLEATAAAREALSDLQFTTTYRVPYQYGPYLRAHLATGSMLAASSGVQVEDLDGNRFYDLTGSYGVNVLGYDAYKECIDEGAARARALGPVLGAYHPGVLEAIERIRALSGLDEVSFHMSGTEAVMQAVRLARYHTRRSHLVRFTGAYHGWWEDVQPGPGNPLPPRETYTLREGDARTLHVLRTRRDIACVLVNPLQALHPNASAPSDASLVDSGRAAGTDRAAYADWLRQLREVCTERDLLNTGGTFFELPAENAGGIAKVRAVATHNRHVHDYATWRGLFLMTGLSADTPATNAHVIRSTDGKAAVWAGAVDDLWRLGKPVGVGGPWKDTVVAAGVPSDPYLLTGYDQKALTLSHTAATPVRLRVEVDLTGTGQWVTYRDFEVSAGKKLEHTFPAAYQAYWLRVVADTPTTATAWLTYR
jgi:hypothetical protein